MTPKSIVCSCLDTPPPFSFRFSVLLPDTLGLHFPGPHGLDRVFWHQNLRRSFTSISTFLVHDVLHLPQHTLVARYVHLASVFLLSGLLHSFTEVAAHGGVGIDSLLTFQDSQCTRFFLTQAFGVVLEDGVQEFVRRLRRIWGKQDQKRSEIFNRVVGWVWVIGFLGWSTPAIMYPAARLNTGEGSDVLLPISILRVVKNALA